MLFAAVSRLGREAIAVAVNAVIDKVGEPAGTVVSDSSALCAWPPGSLDAARSQCVEGYCDLEGEPSFDTISGARGDFVLLALRDGGVLAASGRAGGSRPIYVGRISNHTVVLSSHLSLVLAALPVRPDPDLEFLVASLALDGPLPPAGTPYTGVQRVPMGQAWLVGPEREERRSTVRPMSEREVVCDDRELAAQFREALEMAVQRSALGARRIAVMTSGGLDSSSVLALLLRLSKRGAIPSPPAAYCLDFSAPSVGDDRPHRRALEAHLGVRIERITVDQFPHFSLRDFVVDEVPSPLPTHALLVELGRRAMRDGATVLMSGSGGDDVVDGRPALFAQVAQKGNLVSAAWSLHRLRGLVGFTRGRRWRDLLFKPLLRHLVPVGARREHRRRSIVSRYPWAGPRLRAQLEQIVGAPYSNASLDEPPASRYQRLLALPVFGVTRMPRSQEEFSGGHLRRDPFLDDDFLRFVARIPPLALMQGNFLRGLLRESMRGILPESLRLREDKAPLEPACAALIHKAGGFEILERLSRVPLLADLKLVEPVPFRRRFEEIAKQPLQGGWPQVWATLAAEAFLQAQSSGGGAS